MVCSLNTKQALQKELSNKSWTLIHVLLWFIASSLTCWHAPVLSYKDLIQGTHIWSIQIFSVLDLNPPLGLHPSLPIAEAVQLYQVHPSGSRYCSPGWKTWILCVHLALEEHIFSTAMERKWGLESEPKFLFALQEYLASFGMLRGTGSSNPNSTYYFKSLSEWRWVIVTKKKK